MDVFGILTLIGGLAIFLYGMNALSSGLERMAGGALERTLEKTTSSRWKAVLLGLGVTAVIQSSSATTVMVVGFVNSGIMKLTQAAGVIMGANIGTTVTSWILSLAGVSGESVFVKLLKPTSFSPVLALIGVVFLMFSKKEKRRNIGGILCGFAVLMIGMTMMSDAVSPLADSPEFASVMTLFTNPLMGVLVGTAFTAIIQSSSASVGILQALSLSGGITYGMAIPIIMGQNIGTCATALISCIGANRNARRAAMVHLYFNLIGSALFLAIFYAADAVIGFSFTADTLTPAGVAVVHSTFNILATLVLLPFSNGLCKLATLTVRDKPGDAEESRLDERFLQMPSFALEQCKRVADDMAYLARSTMITSARLLETYDERLAQEVTDGENRLDHYEDMLGTYLVKLSARKLLPEDSSRVGEYLHAIGDFERIGDHALNLTEAVQEMRQKQIGFSDSAKAELSVYVSAVREILTITTDAFIERDVVRAETVEPLEEVIDGLRAEIKNRHVDRLQEGACTIEMGFVLADVLTNFERVSDHCSNIAACLIQSGKDALDLHGYLEKVKNADGREQFAKMTARYASRFRLPERERRDAAHVD